MSGVALLPETFSITLAAGLVGFVIASTGRYREALTAGWVVATTSLGTLYLLDVHTATYKWVLINFFVGMGTGSLFTSLNLTVQSNIAPHEVSHALGFFAFFRALGQAIGVAIGGATFDNIFRSKLGQNSEIAAYKNELSKGAAALIEILKTIPDSDARKPALIQTYADSLRLLWPVMCGCAGIALLFSLFIRHHNLARGESMTSMLSLDAPLMHDQQEAKMNMLLIPLWNLYKSSEEAISRPPGQNIELHEMAICFRISTKDLGRTPCFQVRRLGSGSSYDRIFSNVPMRYKSQAKL